MSTYRSGNSDMRAFVEQRIRASEEALASHRPDGVGCCVRCGRTVPCDDMRAARRLGRHYRAWLDDAPLWVDGNHPAGRIRPYVLGIGDGDAP